MWFYPYIRYIKKIIGELKKTRTISSIEISGYGKRRIFIKIGQSKPDKHQENPIRAISVKNLKPERDEKLFHKIAEKSTISSRDVVLAKKYYIIVTSAKSDYSHIWIQRYLLINDEWHLLVPVRSPANGTFKFSNVFPKKSSKPIIEGQHPKFYDQLFKKSIIGFVTTLDNKRIPVKAPVNGRVISIQTLNHQSVVKSKIILLAAMKISRPKNIPHFFYPSDGDVPFIPPSHPDIRAYIPKIIPEQIGNTIILNQPIPIISTEKGKISYSNNCLETRNIGYPKLVEHEFLDFVTSNEPLALIEGQNQTFNFLSAPQAAKIGGFQIQNGDDVDPGDIIMFLLKKAE